MRRLRIFEQLGVWGAALIGLLSLVPFLPNALWYYFQNDDWVCIGYYGGFPASSLWKMFLPWRSVWMYRPLQALEYAGFYKLFGLQPLPYNLSLLAMHVAACVLGYVLLRLVANARLAIVSIAVFAVMWVHAETLLWKGNINTLQHACLALSTCICFVKGCRSGERRWLVAANVLLVLDFLAKESAVLTPALMLLCVWCAGAGKWRMMRVAIVRLVPSVLLTAVYVAIRATTFKHVLPEEPTKYTFVGPSRGAFQFLYIYKYALLSFYEDPLMLPRMPAVRDLLQILWGPSIVLAPLLALLAIRLRDRVLGFGLLWLPVAFGPTLMLEHFNIGRYYYLTDFGTAVIWAQVGLLAVAAVQGVRVAAVRNLVLGLCVLLLSFFVVANIATTRKQVMEQEADSQRTRQLFEFVKQHRLEIPPKSLVWIKPQPHVPTGMEWGAREMARFATGDMSLEGWVEGEPLTMARRARLDGYRAVYLDMNSEPWRLATGK